MEKQTANKSSKGWRITYNAKFTLTFCLIAVILLNLNVFNGGVVNHYLGLSPSIRFFEFYRLVTYIVCHGSYEHLFSNLLFLIISKVSKYEPISFMDDYNYGWDYRTSKQLTL